MKKLLFTLAIVLVLVSACQDAATTTPASPTATPAPPTDAPVPPTDTPAPPTDTPVPPTDTPLPPTDTPEPIDTPAPTPVLITSAEELYGTWKFVLKESGFNPIAGTYALFDEDGTYYIGSAVGQALISSPSIRREYWFKDGELYLRDTGGSFYGECSPEIVGVYRVELRHDGKVEFVHRDDKCTLRRNDHRLFLYVLLRR